MTFKRIIDLKKINFWYLASGIALNLFWTMAITMFVSLWFVRQFPGSEGLMPILLMVVTFLGPFLIGWLIGSLANDRRGPTYGLFGSIGSVGVLVVAALPTGWMGVMLMAVAVAGGLNGGISSLRKR